MTIDFRTGIEKQLARENKKMRNEFTANIAKAMVNDFNTEASLKKFTDTIGTIKSLAMLGKTSFSSYVIPPYVIEQLRLRGFKVNTCSDQRDGEYTKISWE